MAVTRLRLRSSGSTTERVRDTSSVTMLARAGSVLRQARAAPARWVQPIATLKTSTGLVGIPVDPDAHANVLKVTDEVLAKVAKVSPQVLTVDHHTPLAHCGLE